jgi:hypothetical protein
VPAGGLDDIAGRVVSRLVLLEDRVARHCFRLGVGRLVQIVAHIPLRRPARAIVRPGQVIPIEQPDEFAYSSPIQRALRQRKPRCSSD